MKNEPVKSVTYYMGLPYTIALRPDDEGDVVAKIEELPGCSSHGSSSIEALANLKEAQQLWIEDCLDAGQSVPEPTPQEVLPSGKWVQRIPRSLHQKLIRLARRESVSLNQLVTAILAEATGHRESAEGSVTKHWEHALDWSTWSTQGSRERWHIHHYPEGVSKLLAEALSSRPGRIRSEGMFQHGYQKSPCH